MQIARNITTNEMANSLRYAYLKGSDGRFRNPYDSGCRKNCVDFLLNGYNEDIEVPWEPIQQHGGVIQMGDRYELFSLLSKDVNIFDVIENLVLIFVWSREYERLYILKSLVR